MKILGVGVGSIRRRQLGNLNLLSYENMGVVDINDENLDYAKKNFKVKETFRDFKATLLSKNYDVASILTPLTHHLSVAFELVWIL